MPEKLKIIGFSRRDWQGKEFKSFAKEAIISTNNLNREKKEKLSSFLGCLVFVQGNFDDFKSYQGLKEKIDSIEKSLGQCGNKSFHLAVPPSFYETIFKNLADSGLTIPCGGDLGWSRVLVEKPFGSDSLTALKLDKMLGKLFKEEQIFRIDHYLAKETLQNILAFRFSNVIFEPLWSAKFIDRIEINLFEKEGVSGRGAFYDEVGALKDVGQNHLLAMLALVAMEKPKEFKALSIRKERSKILEKLKPFSKEDIKENVVRGQYEGFKEEDGVEQDSKTETFFRVKTFIKNKRWKGVPFYLESGKSLSKSEASIKVFFKDRKKKTRDLNEKNEGFNQLTFRIQPDEGIDVHFWVKSPGFEYGLEEKTLSYLYDTGRETIPSAYEKVLFDCIKGDQTLFASTEEIQASWKFISSILDNWEKVPLKKYKAGSDPREIKNF